jgi:protein-disulfide isomerase
LSDARIEAIAKATGLDTAGLSSADIVNEINANLSTARALRVSGTPTFVVGEQMLSGAVGYDALKAAVAKARTAKS